MQFRNLFCLSRNRLLLYYHRASQILLIFSAGCFAEPGLMMQKRMLLSKHPVLNLKLVISAKKSARPKTYRAGVTIFIFFSFSTRVVRLRPNRFAALFFTQPVFSNASSNNSFSNSSTVFLRLMPSSGIPT